MKLNCGTEPRDPLRAKRFAGDEGFTIAVNRRTKQDDSVDYIDVVAWDKLAETSNTCRTKGMPVLVEGRLTIRPYESKSGEEHKAADVVISLMQMLNRGTSRESNPSIDSGGDLEPGA